MIDATKAEPELVRFDAPEEPALHSVVLDRNGRAWQRLDPHRDNAAWQRHRWASTGAAPQLFGTSAQPWSHLVVDLGPLTILHRAEA